MYLYLDLLASTDQEYQWAKTKLTKSMTLAPTPSPPPFEMNFVLLPTLNFMNNPFTFIEIDFKLLLHNKQHQTNDRRSWNFPFGIWNLGQVLGHFLKDQPATMWLFACSLHHTASAAASGHTFHRVRGVLAVLFNRLVGHYPWRVQAGSVKRSETTGCHGLFKLVQGSQFGFLDIFHTKNILRRTTWFQHWIIWIGKIIVYYFEPI